MSPKIAVFGIRCSSLEKIEAVLSCLRKLVDDEPGNQMTLGSKIILYPICIA